MKYWLMMIALVAAVPALAQHRPVPDHLEASQPKDSGHARMQDRAIKALSETQIADLRAGRGMSLALPAELNGYPGPSHALELAGQLGLSEEQQQRTKALFAQMQAAAKQVGEQLIADERELDRIFKERRASIAMVEQATATAARTQGELRAVHLRHHLLMLDVLTSSQASKYNELRGHD